MKKWIALLCLILCLSLGLNASAALRAWSYEDVLTEPEILVLARVSALSDLYYTEGSEVCVYTLDILEVYKGKLAEKTVTLRDFNAFYNTPRELIYGEDLNAEYHVWVEDRRTDYLGVGEQYILELTPYDEKQAGYYGDTPGGYRIGIYFIEQGDGKYRFIYSYNETNSYLLDPKTLREEIARVTK